MVLTYGRFMDNEQDNHCESIINIQNKLNTMQESISDALNKVFTRDSAIQQKIDKFKSFLEGLQQRGLVLQKYSAELLQHEREYSLNKKQFDEYYHQNFLEMNKEYQKMKYQLSSVRTQLLSMLHKKTQISNGISNISQTLSTLTKQEQALDSLLSRASRVISRFNVASVADPKTQYLNDINHMRKLIELAEQEIEHTKEKLVQDTKIEKNIINETKEMSEIKELMKKIRGIKQSTISIQSDLHAILNTKIKVSSQINSKKEDIKHIIEHIKEIQESINEHRNIECSTFVESQKSFHHSEKMCHINSILLEQIEDSLSIIESIKSTMEDQSIEEIRLKEEINTIDSDLKLTDLESGQITQSLEKTEEEISIFNENGSCFEREEDESYKTIVEMQVSKQNAIIEETSLRLILKSLSTIDCTSHDASEVQDEKEVYIRSQQKIQCELEDEYQSISHINEMIDQSKMTLAGYQAQIKRLKSDVLKPNQCPNSLEVSQRLEQNSYSRDFSIQRLQNCVSSLTSLLEKKRTDIEQQRDFYSTKKANYESYVSAVTLARSRRITPKRNTIEDKLEFMNLVSQTVEGFLTSLTNQIKVWKNLEKGDKVDMINDWGIDLSCLRDKAEDLFVWNQVYGKDKDMSE